MKKSLVYIALAAAAGVLGYLSRCFAENLPFFIAEYAGDTFWAFALYSLIKSIFPNYHKVKTAFATYLISLLVEVSQLFHTPWIDKIRHTFIGTFILGFGFHWEDLICYAAGISLALICDYLFFTHEN
ncbi:MAG: DUF2809 domain-containing protein [Bacteroidetes bacterium]|nr:DUF2809 domain-containing protein [Bacteroidota bacterium]